MSRLILVISLVLSLVAASTVQAQDLIEGKIYKNAKIRLTSGALLTAKSFMVRESNLQLLSNTALGMKPVALSDVAQIQVATQNYLIIGALAGAAVGTAAMLIAEKIFEEPKTEYKSGPGWWEERTTTRTFGTGYKIIIIGGGTVVGAIIGSLIKGGWEMIYPTRQSYNDISFDFSLIKSASITPAIGIRYRF